MTDELRQRLVGAVVLVLVAVIFLPMFFRQPETEDERVSEPVIPPKPEADFSSRIVPLAEESLGDAGTEPAATVEPKLPQAPIAESSPAAPEVPAGTAPAAAGEAAMPAEMALAAPVETAPAEGGLGGWVVQVGSFSRRENAVALEARLKTRGFSAFVEELTRDKKTIYRVRIGPELSKDKAIAVRDQVQKESQLDGVVVRYP